MSSGCNCSGHSLGGMSILPQKKWSQWSLPWPCGANAGKVVLCYVNQTIMAVVAALKTGSAKDKLLMHLLHCLHFFTAHAQLCIVATHIPGRLNMGADAISRNYATQLEADV